MSTTPNKPIVPAVVTRPIDIIRSSLANDETQKQILNFFDGNMAATRRFQTAAIEYVRRQPKLLLCDRTSLIMSLITVAQLQFLPSGFSGEAYIIPYKNEAKFQIGYKGLITLLYRSKKVSTITAKIVYANDLFEYEEGLNPILRHVPIGFGKNKGEAVAVYTVAQMPNGARSFHVMDKAAVMAIKALSKAKNSPDSPWNSNLDPELWMWKKTCLIQHLKTLPTTPEVITALERDFEGEGLDKPALDGAGPATGRALHGPAAAPKEEESKPVVEGDGSAAGDPGPLPSDTATAPFNGEPPEGYKGKLCPAGRHVADKMETGECEYCAGEEFSGQGVINL